MSDFELVEGCVEYKNMLIGIDFDGTCVTHEYPRVGKDIGAVPVLKKIVEAGHTLVLNTMRGNPETDLGAAIKWFSDNGIRLHCINCAPGQKDWTASPKVYAHVYIDDAALGCPLIYDEPYRPYVDWARVESMLIEMGILPND
jgi:hypothetical protein